ncbi:MAG: hypothetical protein P4M01_00445 [Acidobacteriota bacterium]|nr:hypothetical protein [Acidobacteriota bacterium]
MMTSEGAAAAAESKGANVGNATNPSAKGAALSPLRLVVLAVLFTVAAALESQRLTALFSADVWWHLRAGLWMLQHHAVIRFGEFTQSAQNPWVASSWGYEVLLAILYRIAGLKAVCVALMLLKTALAAITFWVAYAARRNFWTAVVLSLVAQYVLVELQPIPIVLSMLLFAVELYLLLSSRRGGDVRFLYALPPLFLIWANLHPLFVYGLLLLVLFVAAQALEKLYPSANPAAGSHAQETFLKLCAASGASLFATLLNPFSIHVYEDLYATLFSRVQFNALADMAAMEFRRPENFVLMLLVMAAFLALGLRRSRDVFSLSALALFVMISFRIRRDAWTVVLLSIAVLAECIFVSGKQEEAEAPGRFSAPSLAGVCGLSVLLLAAAIFHLPSNAVLTQRLATAFPVKACDYIRANALPAPVFNSFSWGGFMEWYLPEYPVVIDGRLNLYGEEASENYFKLVGGALRLEDSPAFTGAQTILIERKSGLAKALTELPALSGQFHVVYQDDLASVIVRNPARGQ